MQLDEVKRELSSHGVIKTFQFGISAADESHIMSLLRDNIYSDKILAFIREYCTNAADAHVESGQKDRPFDVHIPTFLEPFFSVRDYGYGIAPEDIEGIYVWYGNSTKRASNAVVGTFGLGSKSLFAYTDSFTIRSFYKGMRRTYSAYIDEHNHSQTSLLEEVETQESSGLEIIAAIHQKDIDKCKSVAQRFFCFFEPQPNINMTLKKLSFTRKTSEYAFVGDPYSVNCPVAVMGNVAYPINYHAMETNTLNQFAQKFLQSNSSVLYFDIGELSVSVSRESLEYKDKTKNSILQKLKKIEESISDELNAEIAKCKTPFDAKIFYKAKTDYRIGDSFLYQFTTGLTYNGVPITDWSLKLAPYFVSVGTQILSYETIKFMHDGKFRRHFPTVSEDHKNNVLKFHMSKNILLVVNDEPFSWKKKIEANVTYDKEIIILHADKIPDFENKLNLFIKENHIDGIPILYTSDLECEDQEGGANSSVRTNDSLRKNDVFTLDGWNKANFISKNDLGALTDIIPDGEQIYIPIYRYRSCFQELKLMESLRAAKCDIKNLKIYGVRKNKINENMSKDWISLEAYTRREVIQYLDTEAGQKEFLESYIRANVLADYHFEKPSNVAIAYLQEHCTDIAALPALSLLLETAKTWHGKYYHSPQNSVLLGIMEESWAEDVRKKMMDIYKIRFQDAFSELERKYPISKIISLRENFKDFNEHYHEVVRYINLEYKERENESSNSAVH